MESGKSVKDQVGFAVEPRRNCPHIKAEWLELLTESFETRGRGLLEAGCKSCGDSTENWICIACGGVFCSRYIGAHMSEHNSETKHPISFSLSDASFWCYECDSYITSMMMNLARTKFSKMKFPDGDDTAEMDRLATAFKKNLKLEDKPKEEKEELKFTREDLVNGLRDKKYKKIVFLTGAGISVSSGIPDFRTPGTGLYSQLQKYNLPQPEAVFHIGYFRTNPEPFYLLMKESFKADVKPAITHKFIKKVNDEGLLCKAVTQNIDGLELDAGLPLDKLIQAHGHSRNVRCIECKKDHPTDSYKKAIDEQKVLRCECNGLIKPDIIFFGEALPKEFAEAVDLVGQADLVIIMGTSLVVFPFAMLVQMIDEKTPLVLINNTDSRPGKRQNSLWLDGNLDERVKELAHDLKWDL